MAGVIVADASVLIGFLDEADPHHDRAIGLLSAVQRFVAHPITLAEVLVHPVQLGIEDDVLARLTAIGMTPSPLPINPVLLARMRVRSGLKMPDCVVLVFAGAHGCGIATFDERLAAFHRTDN